MRSKWLIIVLVILLAACGGDKDADSSGDPTPSPETIELGGGLALNTGGDAAGDERRLPGCSNPDAEDCPVPLDLPLDGEVSAGGVNLAYPARYFDATTSEDGAALIEIAPNANNKFQDKATFQVYFAESIDAALAQLENPESAEWSTATLTGTIGVAKDETQDPPVTTSIGAFETADGRVVVLKAITTGQYGWDLHALLYEQLLESLTVEAE